MILRLISEGYLTFNMILRKCYYHPKYINHLISVMFSGCILFKAGTNLYFV
jgi:hypothetical protein